MELAWLLEANGARVIGPIGNVDDALAHVIREGFEIAVVDINLQGAMCYACADELKRQRVPFVFASAYFQKAIPERFSDVHHWQKPYDQKAMIEDVRGLCASCVET